MNASVLSATGSALADSLLRSTLEGALVALAVLGVCRLLPAISPTLRCWLWWLVGLKLLLSLAGVGLIRVPLLPSPVPMVLIAPTEPAPAVEAHAAERAATGTPSIAGPVPSSQPGPSLAVTSPHLLPSWRALIAGLWAAGALVGLALLGREALAARRLCRSAEAVPDDFAARAFGDLPRRFGMATAPPLKISTAVSGPQVVGFLRPQILLPPDGLADAGSSELTLLLAHELAHVQRGDLWLGWVPALVHRLFFFHPLAALAVREYVLAREAACDAAVLRLLGAAPREYGRMLLRWGVTLRESGLAAAGASSSARNLKRRLEMLHDVSRSGRQGLRWASVAAGLALAALLPIEIVARAPAVPATPAVPAAEPAPSVAAKVPVTPTTPSTATTPTVATSQPVSPTPIVATAPAQAASAEAAVQIAAAAVTAVDLAMGIAANAPAIARIAPAVAATAVTASASGSGKGSTTSYHYDDDPDSDLEGWAYVEAGDSSNIVMTGFHTGWKTVERLRSHGDGPFLWVRRDGTSYVVRDADLLAEVQRIVEPMNELGAKQGELGAKQGELGAKQGELGARQGDLGAEQGKLGAQQGRLAAEQAQIAARQAALVARQVASRGSSAELDRQQEELDAEMDRLGRQMHELGRQQGELGERQGELGQKQAELGEKQAELGEKQAQLGELQAEAGRRAQKEIASLLERALAASKAEKVD